MHNNSPRNRTLKHRSLGKQHQAITIALSKLQLRRRKSSTEIVYEPSALSNGIGITVCVEDFGDSPACSDDEYDEPDQDAWSAPRTKFAPTALPPLVR